jgi:hypothetical protein
LYRLAISLPFRRCLVQNNTAASVPNLRHTSRQFAQDSSSKNPLFSRRAPSRHPCHDFIRPPQLRASDADGLRAASRRMPRPPRPQRPATQVSRSGRVDQERRSGRGQGTPGAGCVHRSSLQKSAESCSRYLESYAKRGASDEVDREFFCLRGNSVSHHIWTEHGRFGLIRAVRTPQELASMPERPQAPAT